MYPIACSGCPVSRACTPRVSPHPGHHNPVVRWNRQPGNRLPAADGSLRAVYHAAEASAAPLAGTASFDLSEVVAASVGM